MCFPGKRRILGLSSFRTNQQRGQSMTMNGFTIGLAAGMAAGAWAGMRIQANRRQVRGTIRTAAQKTEDAFDRMTR